MKESPTAPRSKRYDGWVIAIGLVLLAGAVFRLVHLDADPSWQLWGHHVTDEGRWTEQARRLALFGSLDLGYQLSRLHLLLAPLFQAATWASFSLFGVGFTSARLVSAASGVVLLLVMWAFVRSRYSPGPAFATVAILSLDPELVHLSRAAIPETAALLFSFLAFATLLSGTRTRGRLIASGMLTLVAAGFKATVAPLALILAVVAAVTSTREALGGLKASAWYLAGATFPVALAMAAILVSSGPVADQLIGAIGDATHFTRLDDVYGATARFFYSPVVAALGPLFLSCWLVAAFVSVSEGPLPGSARDVYIGSAIWVAGLVIASSAFDYFPDRYLLHVVVPLAVNLGAGLTLLQRIGIRRVVRSMGRLRGWKRLSAALWLAAPVAWLLGPSIVATGELTGYQWDRLRHHLAIFMVLTGTLGWGLSRVWGVNLILWVTSVPLLAVALRGLSVLFGFEYDAFWSAPPRSGIVGALLVLVAGAALAPVRGTRWGRVGIAAPAFAGVVLGFWIYQGGRPLLAPTYTTRDAATAIETLVEPGEVVETMDAAGVLLPTNIRYEEGLGGTSLPAVFLEFKPRPLDWLSEYKQVGRWELDLSPYQLEWGDAEITLYRRIDGPGDP